MLASNDTLLNVYFNDIKNSTYVIPAEVNKIGSYAFSSCELIKEITIPDNITSIDRYAFYHCNNLEKIIISDNVNFIELLAFALCEKVKEIKLPHSLIRLGFNVFRRETEGLTIIYDETQLDFAKKINDDYKGKINLVMKPYNCKTF